MLTFASCWRHDGSSVWMTCIALGIILSVSHTDVERIVGTGPQEEEEMQMSNDNPLAHE